MHNINSGKNDKFWHKNRKIQFLKCVMEKWLPACHSNLALKPEEVGFNQSKATTRAFFKL